MMNSPLKLLTGLLADVGRLDPLSQGLERDILTLQDRFEHEGIGFVTVALGRYADHFDQWLAKRTVSPLTGFRRKPNSPLPALLSGLVRLVFDEVTGTLREDYDLGAVKSVRQILRFFKKAVIAENAETLHTQETKAFYEREKTDTQIDTLMSVRLRQASGYVLGGLDTRVEAVYTSCRNGPGAVAERCVGNQKWSTLVDQIDSYDLFPNSQFDLSMVEKEPGASTATKSLPKTESRFVTVPKSVTARRGITVEPLMMMFYQQGLNAVLRQAINRCPLLSQSLDLTDQRKNQLLALEGSRTGYWATLDLSSASDLLLNKVVDSAFWGHPVFHGMLQKSRSLLKGKTPMKKYAGMGNATTFPVQSVVFTLIAGVAMACSGGRPLRKVALQRCLRSVRVYGDDIVVPTHYAASVAAALESVGLRVNHNKSFTEGNFRESCGVDAFMGTEVSPIYYRLDPRQTAIDDDGLATLVSTSNQLWLEGYYTTSNAIRQHVEASYGNLPYALNGSGLIGWVVRGRLRLKTRYNVKLQRPEYRGVVARPRMSTDTLDGYPALFKFFNTTLLERERGHLERSAQRHSNVVTRRWVPVIPVTSTFLP
jgi:hypothetical protein